MRKFILLLLLVVFFLAKQVYSDSCVVTYDGMVITEDTVFCKGSYNLSNGIIINVSNIVLDCDGAILNGSGTYKSIGINVSGNNVIVKNCDITNYYYGIYVLNFNNTIIKDNKIYLTSGGGIIRFSYSDNNSIIDNAMFSNSNGAQLYWSNNNILLNNSIYDNGFGIQFYDSENNIVENNRIYSNKHYGIQLDNENILNNNVVYSNGEKGIQFQGGFNLLVNNTIYNQSRPLTNLDYYYYNEIGPSNSIDNKPVYYLLNKQNLIIPPNAVYIGLIECTNITVSDLEIKNQSQGIIVYKTNGSIIKNVNISNNEGDGIYIWGSYNTIKNCRIYSNEENGIELSNFDYGTIEDCIIYSNNQGINLYSSSDNNIIHNNEIYSNKDTGMYVNGNHNNITYNEIYSNTNDGLYITYDGPNTLRSNSIYSNKRNLVIYNKHPNDIDTSNTVDGKPIYYLVNQSTIEIPSNAGYVALIESNNITVSDLQLKNTYYGLLIYKTNNSIIKNLDISNNEYGLYIFQSEGNTIKNNDIYSNKYKGLSIYSSSNNSIKQNTIKNNEYGIYIYSYDVDLLNGSITYNSIFDNSKYNIYLNTADKFSAENNWWGSVNKGIIETGIYTPSKVDYEPYLYGPFDGNQIPVINNLECQSDGKWDKCSILNYTDTLTKVRVNCTDRDGTISKATFELKSLSDYQTIFTTDGNLNSDYWVYDNDDLLLDYWGLALTVRCEDNSSGKNGLSEAWILKEELPPSMLFYEGFESIDSVIEKNGSLYNSPIIVDGIIGNAIDFSGSKKVCYPIPENVNETNGTIEFLVKVPPGDGYGFFDIGHLGRVNSWGIFKNVNYLIMEVKNYVNSFDQAWSPNSWPYDGKWHFVAAVWERDANNYTRFKVFLDGEGKPSYDGGKADSFPNMTRAFCLGYCGWYGYSESIMDEVRIYNYVKSDEEIKQDYLSIVNYTKEDLPKKECIMHKPESLGKVKINCSGLYVNNKSFTVKGVGYQPIPIGKTAESLSDKQKMYNDIPIRERDFPLLREMNVNTIRTWGEVMNMSWMDDLYNNGVNPIYVVMGFWINCNENYGDSTIKQNYINKFTDYVNEYKDHPAVLAWALGNENNLGYCSSSGYIDDFYSLCNELARIAYEIEGDDYHPVGIINGDVFNMGLEYYNADDLSLKYIDFWGSNVYPGRTFGDWFDDYATLSGKPLLITEYGIDALNNSDYGEYEDVHAEWVLRQWNEINNADMTIGSTLMAYSDEWWKAGSPSSHNYGGYSTNKHPDGYSNEEWWGVMRTVDNGGNPDIMEPREVYYALQEVFGEMEIGISLVKGWNLISIPLIPKNNSVNRVFGAVNYSDIIYYSSGWKNATKINSSFGYWVKSGNNQSLNVRGVPDNNPQIIINNGWNLIGYPYLEEKNISEFYSNITVFAYKDSQWYSYNPDKPSNTLNKFIPGYGYWVKSS